ncbi:THAP domain-containing protein 2-like [Choristoneura fumiferana]|uniref:THAP domain-containing protein 2-like n=1 Tax=Choristoneura fumiferana TaxID=7141 RepID=UPI003D15F22D
MPQCSFINCGNSHRNTRVSEGISFFRFPSDPFRCAEWTSIVAREREEELYRPHKNSTVCSIHFDKFDIVGNSQRRRLRKTAIPKLQILVKQNTVQAAVRELTESMTSNLVKHLCCLFNP